MHASIHVHVHMYASIHVHVYRYMYMYTCMAYTHTIVGRRATESSMGGPSRLCTVNVQIVVLREDITYRIL